LIISLALLFWQLFIGYIAFMMAIYVYHFLYKVRMPINLEHVSFENKIFTFFPSILFYSAKMVNDLCRALIYIRDHIHEHFPQADPNQIFLSGHSAGAHLTSLLVLDKTYFERHNYPLSSIRGVITMSGIYTLSNPIHDSKYNIRNLIFRVLYSSNLLYPEGKTIVEYSPIEYIKENDQLPPFLVMSARFDMGLEVDAKRFVEKFRKYNHPVKYYTIGGMTTHATIASKFSKTDAQRHYFTFIRQNMK
jgi:acetyl esterase/lipase